MCNFLNFILILIECMVDEILLSMQRVLFKLRLLTLSPQAQPKCHMQTVASRLDPSFLTLRQRFHQFWATIKHFENWCRWEIADKVLFDGLRVKLLNEVGVLQDFHTSTDGAGYPWGLLPRCNWIRKKRVQLNYQKENVIA